MDYIQLRRAVSEAVWQKDYAKFTSLIHSALAATEGEDHGRVLNLQASWFVVVDVKQGAQGFVLIDEALPFLRKNPEALLGALNNALGLCYRLSDVERARIYEEEASSLLLEHGADPGVRARRHRLQLSLGQMAYLRSDFATAYWHFVQAANCVADSAVAPSDRHGFESLTHVHVAMACLRVRRYWEAQEALDLAEQSAHTDEQRLRALVWRGELLRQLGRLDEAQALLGPVTPEVATCDSPEVRGRYYVVSAQVAHDAGHLSEYHQFLSKAQTEAYENCHDYLLSEIQRFQRSPM